MLLEILQAVLFIVFIFSSLLLIIVILLQEGKGGGLASAFGGMGGEAFGVGAGGINKFTAYLAVVFIGSAVLLAAIDTSPAPKEDAPVEVPDEAGESGAGDSGAGDSGEAPADENAGSGEPAEDVGDTEGE